MCNACKARVKYLCRLLFTSGDVVMIFNVTSSLPPASGTSAFPLLSSLPICWRLSWIYHLHSIIPSLCFFVPSSSVLSSCLFVCLSVRPLPVLIPLHVYFSPPLLPVDMSYNRFLYSTPVFFSHKIFWVTWSGWLCIANFKEALRLGLTTVRLVPINYSIYILKVS